MFAPHKLDANIRARSFKAANGELGIAIEDVGAFLKSCAAEGLAVLGWEAWIVDHTISTPPDMQPRSAPGRWLGLIPHPKNGEMQVICNTVDISSQGLSRHAYAQRCCAEAERQIHATDFKQITAPAFFPALRINFTLEQV